MVADYRLWEISVVFYSGYIQERSDYKIGLSNARINIKLAMFIKSEMLREVRENCFCKYQRYPIITVDSQKKTIMTDKRHNIIINYNKHFGNTTRT